jgi:hypothetical protein
MAKLIERDRLRQDRRTGEQAVDVRAGGGIAMRGDENDRSVALLADAARRFDAVHAARQADVHQDQIDVEIGCLFNRAGPVRDETADLEVLLPGERLEVPRHQQLVLDNQHPR